MEKDYISNEVQVTFLDGLLCLIIFQYFTKDAKMRVFRFELLFFDVYNISKVGLAGVEEDIDEVHLAGIGKVMIETFLTSLS